VNSGEGGSEHLVAFLGLMHAKEYAGIERAVGSNAFASGVVTRENHKRALDLAARQEAFFVEFRELMGPVWTEKLDNVLTSTDGQAVLDAREVLHNGGYLSAVSGYSGSDWFELTTRRIDALMAVEAELGAHLINQAATREPELRQAAYITLAIAGLVAIGTIVLSYTLMVSVVTPIKRITKYLDRLADGDTTVVIKGTTRKDEIGVLSRAASAFLKATREREEMIKQKSELDRKSVEERRRLLTNMAEDVKTAAKESVGGVAATADDLEAGAERMRQDLVRAGERANEADAATSATMEKTEQATSLANEITLAISEVAEQIDRGNLLARDAVEKAALSRDTIGELEQAARQVGEFVEIISDLAEQTNLLALNATIEAARAGEMGKGFAVVASEVKGLAEQTNKSTAQISERVQQIQERTESVVEAMTQIANSIDSIGDVTGSVAAAMEEQRATTS
ncbi:MAG: methyl-accepting chemotaxis protein, partial [Pseudomonadota bacterium]